MNTAQHFTSRIANWLPGNQALVTSMLDLVALDAQQPLDCHGSQMRRAADPAGAQHGMTWEARCI